MHSMSDGIAIIEKKDENRNRVLILRVVILNGRVRKFFNEKTELKESSEKRKSCEYIEREYSMQRKQQVQRSCVCWEEGQFSRMKWNRMQEGKKCQNFFLSVEIM